ncbi:hypothetical protein TVNIR_3179 [Thioalkalivibrio nitratireducens DSM 14787]|uniref:Uncharacterized protein n=1 Tax=Thioalkalivibrio nitratireducens (strain DSM 14787 / UNIQEM 213 / ALEN2) TaxID=1255043 RepID=L0E2D3_THIND|nr:hypothetical protein [Thioalkalivibrio nitratireducens]AGA34816.1 hypothetical protein TVNIR_3179 [Thioalkalivibrio nitratireducens DSM 14787]
MSTGRLDLTDVEYWESDGGTIYACVGPKASDAMLRLSRAESGGAWEWLPLDGSVWNAAHQAMYRNDRWDQLEPERIAAFPPLPEQVSAGQRSAALRRREPMFASRFPLLAEQIRTGPATGLPVFAVLHEDTYESALGDGKFAYLHAVFLDPADAEKECARLSEAQWSRGHLRRMSVALERGQLLVPDHEREWFDRVTVEGVVGQLEKQLA